MLLMCCFVVLRGADAQSPKSAASPFFRLGLPGSQVTQHATDAAAALIDKGRRVLALLDLGLDGREDAHVLPLEGLEVVVQLLVPRVQHTHLEAERRAGDDKVGDGESASDDHVDGWRSGLYCCCVVLLK